MGMFDTVVPDKKNPVRCPGCKKILDDFQTKDLECALDVFTEGTTARTCYKLKIITKSRRGKLGFPIFEPNKKKKYFVQNPRYLRFYAYDWCKKDKKMVSQHFQFTDSGMLERYGKAEFE
jgi:hypothetical protein